MIEPVQSKPEEQETNKPLINIQLPAPMNGDPNAPLSVGKHNATAQYNFQQIANVLLAIINNQKMMGLAINQLTEKQKELEKSVGLVSDSIRKFINIKENDENESIKPKPTDN